MPITPGPTISTLQRPHANPSGRMRIHAHHCDEGRAAP